MIWLWVILLRNSDRPSYFELYGTRLYIHSIYPWMGMLVNWPFLDQTMFSEHLHKDLTNNQQHN